MLPRLRVRLLQTLMSLPGPAGRLLETGPEEIDGHPVDPALRRLLGIFNHNPRKPHSYPVAEQRRAYRWLARRASGRAPRVHTTNLTDGPVPMRRYRSPTPTDATVVWLHGGGWVIGDLETHDAFCRRLAHDAGVHVIAVDYRLAPEHRHPTALDDSLAAWRWLRDQPFCTGRVALGGDSAGGNLTAIICQRLALAGEPQPHTQLLLYPGTDATRSMPSHLRFADGFFLDNAQMELFLSQYTAHRVDPRDPSLSPLFADSVHGVAPALVFTAAMDPLVDEGHAYAELLREAGIEVHQASAPAMIHGFISLAGLIPSADEATDRFVAMVRKLLML